MPNIKPTGLYTLKEDYFRSFPQYSWDYNKDGKRPYYYAIKDKYGFMWMIPITTKVESVKSKIAKEEAKRGKGNCDLYYIGKIAGEDRGFKVGEMFPVTEEYVLHNYAINNKPYFVRDSTLNNALNTKAHRFLSLIEKRAIKPSVDVLAVRDLLKRNGD